MLSGLEKVCSGIITATCNVTAQLSRKVYDDFFSNNSQSSNEKLCNIRKVFDNHNLISALHTFCSKENTIYENVLPPLRLLNQDEEKELMENLKKLNFTIRSPMAA